MRYLRVTGWFLAIVLLLLLCGDCFLWSTNLRARWRAEALLQEMQTLKIGESTTVNVLGIANRFGGVKVSNQNGGDCSADDSYAVGVSNVPWSKPLFLRAAALRPWYATSLVLLKQGKVCYFQYEMSVEVQRNKMLMLRSEMLPTENGVSDYMQRPYGIHDALIRNYIGLLEVGVTTRASQKEIQHAFAFNLACLTNLRGCQRPCQLMPLAWKDAVERVREGTMSMPEADLNDPQCK